MDMPFAHRFDAFQHVRPVVAGGGEYLAQDWNLVDSSQPDSVLAVSTVSAGPLLFDYDAEVRVELFVRLSTPLPPGMQAAVLLTMDDDDAVRASKSGGLSAAEGFWRVYAVEEDWDPATICWDVRPSIERQLVRESLAGAMADENEMRWDSLALNGAGGEPAASEPAAYIAALPLGSRAVYGFRVSCDFDGKNGAGHTMRVDRVGGLRLVY